MTIYRMYIENGERAGFFVQHRSWANTCARVHTVAGQARGKLPGNAPYYDNAPVEFEWFDVRSGRELEAAASPAEPQDKHYSSIATPWWSRPRPEVVSVLSPVSAGGSKAS